MVSKLEEKLKSRENEVAELQNNISHMNFELLQKNNEFEAMRKKMGESVISMDVRATRLPEHSTATKVTVRGGLEGSTAGRGMTETVFISGGGQGGVQQGGVQGGVQQVSRFESTPESRQTVRYGTPA
jgi:hypothetical protein